MLLPFGLPLKCTGHKKCPFTTVNVKGNDPIHFFAQTTGFALNKERAQRVTAKRRTCCELKLGHERDKDEDPLEMYTPLKKSPFKTV